MFRIYMVGLVRLLVIETDLVAMCVKCEHTHNTYRLQHARFYPFSPLVLAVGWSALALDLLFSCARSFVCLFVLHAKTKRKTRNLRKNQLVKDQRTEPPTVVAIERARERREKYIYFIRTHTHETGPE